MVPRRGAQHRRVSNPLRLEGDDDGTIEALGDARVSNPLRLEGDERRIIFTSL